MHLSRLVVDATDGRAGRTLARPYLLHQAVMAGFDPDRRGNTRVLYRLEPERPRGRAVLLIQSEITPQWHRSFDCFFGERKQAEMKELRLALAAGQRLRFRLRANPCLRRDGKRLGLYGETRQRAWLERKLASAGAVPLDFQVVDEGLVQDRDPHLEFQSALYEGLLQVRIPQALLETVRAGIGSGKGFGFGLLSLAPAR
jgi:CRISPR system Cascade subunit CasE